MPVVFVNGMPTYIPSDYEEEQKQRTQTKVIVESDIDLKKYQQEQERKKAFAAGPTQDAQFNTELWFERFEKDPRFKKLPASKKIEKRMYYFDKYVLPYVKSPEEAARLERTFTPVSTAESVARGFTTGLEWLQRPAARPGGPLYTALSEKAALEKRFARGLQKKVVEAEKAGVEPSLDPSERQYLEDVFWESLRTTKPFWEMVGSFLQAGAVLPLTGLATTGALTRLGIARALAASTAKSAATKTALNTAYRVLHGLGTFGLAEVPGVLTGEITPSKALRHTSSAALGFGVPSKLLGAGLGATLEAFTTPKEELKYFGSRWEIGGPTFAQTLGTRLLFESVLPAGKYFARKGLESAYKRIYERPTPSDYRINLMPGATKVEYTDPTKAIDKFIARGDVFGPLMTDMSTMMRVKQILQDRRTASGPAPVDIERFATQLIAQQRTYKRLQQYCTEHMRADLLEMLDNSYKQLVPEGEVTVEKTDYVQRQSYAEWLECLDNWHRTCARVTAELAKDNPNIDVGFVGRTYLTTEGQAALDKLLAAGKTDTFTTKVLLALKASPDVNLYEYEELRDTARISARTSKVRGGRDTSYSQRAKYLAETLVMRSDSPLKESVLANTGHTFHDVAEVIDVALNRGWVNIGSPETLARVNVTQSLQPFAQGPGKGTTPRPIETTAYSAPVIHNIKGKKYVVPTLINISGNLPDWYVKEREAIENNPHLTTEQKRFFVDLLNSKLHVPKPRKTPPAAPPKDVPTTDEEALDNIYQRLRETVPAGVRYEQIYQFYKERYYKHREIFEPVAAWTRVLREVKSADIESLDPTTSLETVMTRLHLAAEATHPEETFALPQTPLEEQGFSVVTYPDSAGLAVRIKKTSLAGRVVSPMEIAHVLSNKGYEGYVEARTGDIYIKDPAETGKSRKKGQEDFPYKKITAEELDELPSPGDFVGKNLSLVVDAGSYGKYYVAYDPKKGRYFHYPKDAAARRRHPSNRPLSRKEINDLYMNNKGVIIESVAPEGLARIRVMGTGQVKTVSLETLKKLPNNPPENFTPGIDVPSRPEAADANGQRPSPTDPAHPLEPEIDTEIQPHSLAEKEQQRAAREYRDWKIRYQAAKRRGKGPSLLAEGEPSYLPEKLTPEEQSILDTLLASKKSVLELQAQRDKLQQQYKEVSEQNPPIPTRKIVRGVEVVTETLSPEAHLALSSLNDQILHVDRELSRYMDSLTQSDFTLRELLKARKAIKRSEPSGGESGGAGVVAGFLGIGVKPPRFPWESEKASRLGMTLAAMKNATELLALMPRKSVFSKIQQTWKVPAYDVYREVEEAVEKVRESLYQTRPSLLRVMRSLQKMNLDGLMQYIRNDPRNDPIQERRIREFHKLTKEELALVPEIESLLAHSLGPEWRKIITQDFDDYVATGEYSFRLKPWVEFGNLNPKPKDLLELLPNAVYSRARMQVYPALDRIVELVQWLRKVPTEPPPEKKLVIRDRILEGDEFHKVSPEKYIPSGLYGPAGTIGGTEPQYVKSMQKRVLGVHEYVPTTPEERFFLPSEQRQRIIRELTKYHAQVSFSLGGDWDATRQFLERIFTANNLDLDYDLFNRIIPRYLLLTYMGTMAGRLGLVIKQLSQPFFTTLLYSGAKNFQKGLYHAYSKKTPYQLNGIQLAETLGLHEVQSIPQEHLLAGRLPEVSKAAKVEFWLREKFDTSMKLFNMGDVWNRRVSASTGYVSMNDYGKMFLDKKIGLQELLEETGLIYLEDATQREVLNILREGTPDALEAASRLFAKHLAQDTQFLYHAGNTPGILSNTPGRILGQFATWPLNFIRFTQRGLFQGSLRSRYNFLKRMLIVNTVAYEFSKHVLGIDTGSWMFFGPLAYAGGPGTSLLTALHLMSRGNMSAEIGRRMLVDNLLTAVPFSGLARDVLSLFDEDEEDFGKRVIRAVGLRPVREE